MDILSQLDFRFWDRRQDVFFMIQANYFTMITDIGAAAIAKAAVQGGRVNITSFVVGDGGGSAYQPTADRTALKNQTWAGVITAYTASEATPPIVRVTALLPADVGGFTIREMGILDEHGQLIAVANTPDMEKTTLDEGASSEMKLSIEFAVSNAEVLRFAIDPTVVLATKADVKEAADALNAAKVDKAKRTGSATAYKVLSDNNYTDGDKEQVLKIAGFSNPNLLINPDFSVWQRGTAFTTVHGYTADRWLVGGELPVTVNKAENGISIQQGGNWTNFIQCIEAFTALKGKTITLSARVLAPSGIAIFANNGELGMNRFSANPNWQTVSITFIIPTTISALHVGLSIFGTAEINWVKLELGAVATPFVPRLYGEELALCQRYYCTGVQDSSPLDGRYMRHYIRYPVEMRVAPHVVISNLHGWQINPEPPVLYRMQSADSRGITIVISPVIVLMDDATQTFDFTADAEIY